MVIKYTAWVLRIAAALALILGIISWFGVDILVSIHTLLGIIVVLSLWVLGGAFFSTKGGSTLAIIAIVWGIVVLALGVSQKSILPDPSPVHWIIQVLHLIVGLAAIGIGEAIGGRYRRQSATVTMKA
jgi:hypothetical protein